ncbi:MAG TPA: metallophosphoesterase family protein [Armatimonadota bacterium]
METVSIALIADVHANVYALKGFLDFLARHPDIEQVWNLGDFLQIGPDPAEVADLILDDARFLTILGNNEQSLLQRDLAGFPDDEIAHQDWTLAQLGEERLAHIRQLPVTRRLAVGGRRVLLVHEKTTVCEELSETDLLCCGHTHYPAEEIEGTVRIMNPGSLGFGWGPGRASFGVIEIGESALDMRYHSIPFDVAMLRDDYRQRQVPGRERILSVFLPEA